MITKRLRIVLPILLVWSSMVVACGSTKALDNSERENYTYTEAVSVEKKKEINKSFSVGAEDILSVHNRYGNITVTHWNKNEVGIHVVIKAEALTEKRAEALIKRVQIAIDKSGRTISALTSLASSTNSGRAERFSIDYFISMPSKMESALSQKYGNIILPNENSGKRMLEVKYGNIKAGDFSSDLVLTAGYSNVRIGNVANASMELKYCEVVSIDKADKASIESRYSTLKIKEVKDLAVEARYGSLSVEQANTLVLELRYTDGRVGLLKERMSVGTLSYCTLKVDEIASGFKSISAEAHYGNLSLKLPTDISFDVQAEDMKYGNYSIKGFNAQTETDKSDRVCYYSKVNNGNKQRKIYFDGNRYGNLTIRTL